MENKAAMKKYRLPERATQEDLEMRWNTVLKYGDRILVAGHFWNGPGRPCCYGAVYEFLGEDQTSEDEIALRAASEVEFEDEGHAIAWGIQQ